jgi:hypothetical protein
MKVSLQSLGARTVPEKITLKKNRVNAKEAMPQRPGRRPGKEDEEIIVPLLHQRSIINSGEQGTRKKAQGKRFEDRGFPTKLLGLFL